jgi:hypothetical protein
VRHAQENARTAPHAVPTARLRARLRAPAMQNAAQHVQQIAVAIIPPVWIPAKPHAMQNPHAPRHVEIKLLVHPHVPIPVKELAKKPAKIPVIGPVSELVRIPVRKLVLIHAAILVEALARTPVQPLAGVLALIPVGKHVVQKHVTLPALIHATHVLPVQVLVGLQNIAAVVKRQTKIPVSNVKPCPDGRLAVNTAWIPAMIVARPANGLVLNVKPCQGGILAVILAAWWVV